MLIKEMAIITLMPTACVGSAQSGQPASTDADGPHPAENRRAAKKGSLAETNEPMGLGKWAMPAWLRNLRKPRILSRLGGHIPAISRDKSPEVNTRMVELSFGEYSIRLHCMGIPYDMVGLRSVADSEMGRIEGIIKKYCSEHGLALPYSPPGREDLFKELGLNPWPYDGRFLYKLLFGIILGDLTEKRGYPLKELDLAIIAGSSRRELIRFIRHLAPRVKYLTVLEPVGAGVLQGLDSIAEETGLAIRVTEEARSGIKTADLIINLGVLTPETGVKSGAVIINYGYEAPGADRSDNHVLHGIDLRLPKEWVSGLGEEIWGCYSSTGMAEMLMACRMRGDCHGAGAESSSEFGNSAEISGGSIPNMKNSLTFREAAMLYRSMNLTIRGYLGRRGPVKARDIMVCANVRATH